MYTSKGGVVFYPNGKKFSDYNLTHGEGCLSMEGSVEKAEQAAVECAAKLNERSLRVAHNVHEPYCQMFTATDPIKKVCSC
jgi:peptide deformylase